MYLYQGYSAKEKKGKKRKEESLLEMGGEGGRERSMHFLIFCNRKNVLSTIFFGSFCLFGQMKTRKKNKTENQKTTQ